MPKPVKPFASGVVAFAPDKARFTLPAEVLRSVGWEGLGEGVTLIAEFINLGHYRLHRLEHVEERLAHLKERVAHEAATEEEAEAQLQTLADQFREVTFYRSDNNRVTIKPEVTMGLLGDSSTNEFKRLYIQAGKTSIDVMTHEVRVARLRAASQA